MITCELAQPRLTQADNLITRDNVELSNPKQLFPLPIILVVLRLQIAKVTGQTPVWPWFTITSMEAETLDLIVDL